MDAPREPLLRNGPGGIGESVCLSPREFHRVAAEIMCVITVAILRSSVVKDELATIQNGPEDVF